MVGAQLEARVAGLREHVAQLPDHLDVVGQLELAGRRALGERRAGHDGGGAQADDERVRSAAPPASAAGEAAATARITRAVPATCAVAAALPPSPGIT